MSKKAKSTTQQLITFAMNAPEDGLNSVIESITAIRDSRFPPKVKTAAKPRAPRSDKGTKRGLPDAQKANGGDGDTA